MITVDFYERDKIVKTEAFKRYVEANKAATAWIVEKPKSNRMADVKIGDEK